jgi:hypothetical protein
MQRMDKMVQWALTDRKTLRELVKGPWVAKQLGR